MLKIENFEVLGWEHAIRGMRNPKNSWDKSDSAFKGDAFTTCMEDDGMYQLPVQFDALSIGPNDHKLMESLAEGGPVHAKYRRMITVYLDITAPRYWWTEFDTYKVGTVANSCSTMHKIHERDLTLDDFSHEYLSPYEENGELCRDLLGDLEETIDDINFARKMLLETNDKKYWYQMIQLLPQSYNQKRTVMLNYEVLANIYKWRRNHKLDEWHTFCDWIEELPYSELITGYKEAEE